MKKVWVNRFNANGSEKLMGEWELKECGDYNFYSNAKFDGSLTVGFSAKNTKQEVIDWYELPDSAVIEDITDQRGDGWFYVADGHLPPLEEDLRVMAWDIDGGAGNNAAIVKATTVIYHYNRCLILDRPFTYPCWQPIAPPKFMDAP